MFFGCCTVIAIVFAWLFVPETKGVQMEDMDLIFGEGVSIVSWKARQNYLDAKASRAALSDRSAGKSAIVMEEENV